MSGPGTWPIISADDHLIEPPDLFDGRMPAALVADAPRIVEADDGTQAWLYEGNRYPSSGLSAVVGRTKEEFSPEPLPYAEMRPGCYDPKARLEDMNQSGVLASLCFSAMGLLCASRAKTIEGVSGLINLAQVPMWILSGVFFSSERFPAAVQPFIRALPLTALIDGLRAHMLQGASLLQLAPQLGTLGAWLVVCFGLAMKLFRWR